MCDAAASALSAPFGAAAINDEYSTWDESSLRAIYNDASCAR